MKKKGLIIVIALILAAGAGIYLLTVLSSQDKHVNDALNRILWADVVDDLNQALLTDGKLSDKSRECMDRVMDSLEPGSKKSQRLAVYAVIMTEYGYPEEAARRKMTEQIAAMDMKAEYDDAAFKALFSKAPWAMDPVLEKCNQSDGYSTRSMLKLIAEYSRNLPLERRMELALANTNTDFSSVDFLSECLTEADLPELRATILKETDPERLSLYAQALAGQHDRPENIVPVLYHLRQQGQSLGQLFPHGLTVDLDLSALNETQGFPQDDAPLPADAKYLIICRREADVKAERLKTQPEDGYSCNNKENPAAFVVSFETTWMDQIPMDRFPASYEECQWLAVVDLQYIYGGYLTELKDYATGAVEQGKNYYPVYSSLHRLILVEREGLVPRRIFSAMSLDADTNQTVMRWTNIGVGTSMTSYGVAQKFDSTWKSDVIRQFMDRQLTE